VRVLVTGGAGFIGSHFVRALAASGRDEVAVLDVLTYAGSMENLEGAACEFVRGDVACPEDVAGVLGAGRFDGIVNFAAETHVDRSIEEPAPFLRTNVIGTQVLLDAARAAGVARFVHVSTDEVYGPMAQGVCATEDFPLRPSSPYAASKAAADHLVLAARRTWGLPAVIARPSNNYGPRQYPEKAMPLFITNALEGRPLPVYGDGLHERDWLFVDDSVRALLMLLAAPALAHAAYNISFGRPRPNLDIARAILREVSGGEPAGGGPAIEHVADRPGHDRRYAPDSRRVRDELGWEPRVGFDEGLRRTVCWHRENADWWRRIRSGEYRAYYERMYGSRGTA